MSDSSSARTAGPAQPGERQATTAGGLLRRAREQQALPVEALAAAIKVVPKKIEALEGDRYDELADATFVRALAKAMARFLKIDAAPVLALLPPLSGPRRLEEVAEGLNTPFRERSERLVPREWGRVATPAFWLALLIVLATLALYLFPTHWRPWADALTPRAPSAGATVTTTLPMNVPSAVAVGPGEAQVAAPVQPSGSIPSGEPAAAPASAAVAGGILRFLASAPAWVEVVDAERRTLLSRSLRADEEVSLDGTAPFKVKIGNVLATRMTVRGEPFDLSSATRDNVARLEVK